ncbi:PREDICTED: uncharacterized protein LOC104592041 [Nelumbo nucifera]|uniref:Uncharacterized protein LOC104592041 n=1 Tax=Nelumbo nucifera TaxID=4432 RepID=A0A1U7ZA59_NELNU|nr:PREDICTED: uncharacterized protein LOC104592041 [Nelumbo nucifera]
MDFFLEILRCLLCCNEDDVNRHHYVTLDRSPSPSLSYFTNTDHTTIRPPSPLSYPSRVINQQRINSSLESSYRVSQVPKNSTSPLTDLPDLHSSKSSSSSFTSPPTSSATTPPSSCKSSPWLPNPLPDSSRPSLSSSKPSQCSSVKPPSSSKPSPSSFEPPQSSSKPPLSSCDPLPPLSKLPSASSGVPPSPSKEHLSSSRPPQFSSRPPLTSSGVLSSPSKLSPCSSGQHHSSSKASPSSSGPPPSSFERPPISSRLTSSPSKSSSFSSGPLQSSTKSLSSSTGPSPTSSLSSTVLPSSKPSSCSSGSLQSFTKSLPSSTGPSPTLSSSSSTVLPSCKPSSCSSGSLQSFTKSLPSSTGPSPTLSSSSSTVLPQISKLPPVFSKSTFSPTPSDLPKQPTKQIWVKKHNIPIYAIPEDFKDLIEKDIVPGVLKKPLSPSTYKDYFAALLYAEDFYVEKWKEKWKDFHLPNVTLKLHKGEIKKKREAIKKKKSDKKIFVEFQIDLDPKHRPFFLSRDYVYVRPSGKEVQFQGIIYAVRQRNLIIAEFGGDFLSQHTWNCKHNVTFELNRFCLKRAHQAVEASYDPFFWSFLFPDEVSKVSIPASLGISSDQNLKLQEILLAQTISRLLSGSRLHLIEGQLSVDPHHDTLSTTGVVIKKLIIQLYQTSPDCRILVSTSRNRACDLLLGSLMKEIPKSHMFRGNATFRGYDDVLDDILPLCSYEEEEELFTWPSVEELQNFKVIISTYITSARLHEHGICAGHFSHIFLVDASSVTEPEAIVSLVNLADNRTCVIVTGALGNCSRFVRSEIGRANGLKVSYFQRLLKREPYQTLNPIYKDSEVHHDSTVDKESIKRMVKISKILGFPFTGGDRGAGEFFTRLVERDHLKATWED